MADAAASTPRSKIGKIALIGNNPPRLCGIATFTDDVRTALTSAFSDLSVDVYAMNDRGNSYDYPADVVCTIAQDELGDYLAAARRINASGADVVLVQHEYGIFGGASGAMLLRLLERVDAPVVVTLHMVLEEPNTDQRRVIEALARRASRLIVMADKGRDILMRVHGISAEQIVVVPHGVPDRTYREPAEMKPRFGFEGRRVLLTFGLLSPNKGIETMIRAMPRIVEQHPDALYVVLGATHPHLVAHEGEAYRNRLQALAGEIGVSDAVCFIDGYLEQQRLLDYLQATDIYVTPYLTEQQITSGTLSYAVSMGKPVVSTPYWHAAELLADGVGTLVGFEDVDGFASAINDLLGHPMVMRAMAERAYAVGRSMTWERLANSYLRTCTEAVVRRPVRLTRFGAGRERVPLKPRLEAIERMTDGCGMIQHSIFAVPDRDHGYCVDDNCRALMLMHRIDDHAVRADQLATIYASFVQHAWNAELGRFRNFMGFDRNWLEKEGSEDSFGRSVWTIGDTVANARSNEMRTWALHLFDQVAPHALALGSPRTWAFTLLGADAVLQRHPEHPIATRLIAECADRLWRRLREGRRDGWTWFEAVLAYDNVRLPEALMRGARRLGNDGMFADAIETLAWIDAKQTNASGQFRAVGTDSFGRPYADPLPYDQQPLEAWATVDAMLYAADVTGEGRWLDAAWRAYAWYLGDNDLDLPIATPNDGGCFDGLMSDRVNLNQGAESILAFQFACAAMSRRAAQVGHAGRPVDRMVAITRR